MATHQPFVPTHEPLDPEGTSELLDKLDAWFNQGIAAGVVDDDHIADGLAILDELAPVAGAPFTAELTIYLATIGLAGLAEQAVAA